MNYPMANYILLWVIIGLQVGSMCYRSATHKKDTYSTKLKRDELKRKTLQQDDLAKAIIRQEASHKVVLLSKKHGPFHPKTVEARNSYYALWQDELDTGKRSALFLRLNKIKEKRILDSNGID